MTNLLISWQRDLFNEACQVYKLNADGSLKQITQNTSFAFYTGYKSPDPKTCFVVTQYGNEGHLYLYDMETGQQLRELSPNGQAKYAPNISPDGRHMVFFEHAGDGMVLYDWQNDKRTILTNLARPQEISWAPDSQSLVVLFLEEGIKWDTPIWVRLDLTGKEIDRKRLPHFENCLMQALSPDWKRIAFVRLDDEEDDEPINWEDYDDDGESFGDDLLVANIDGTDEQTIGLLNTQESPPVWSPDSKTLAWVGVDNTTEHYQLFTWDGTNVRSYMTLDDAEYADEIYPGWPVWNADSKRLAISSYIEKPDSDDAGAAVFVVDAESGEVRQISDAAGIIFRIAWL